MTNHCFFEMFIDGGVFARNPSPRGVYWSVVFEERSIRKQSGEHHTNNEGEWLALREALQWAQALGLREPLRIYSDSQIVVRQFTKRNQIKVPRLLRFAQECWALAATLPYVSLEWRPRAVIFEKVGH